MMTIPTRVPIEEGVSISKMAAKEEEEEGSSIIPRVIQVLLLLHLSTKASHLSTSTNGSPGPSLAGRAHSMVLPFLPFKKRSKRLKIERLQHSSLFNSFSDLPTMPSIEIPKAPPPAFSFGGAEGRSVDKAAEPRRVSPSSTQQGSGYNFAVQESLASNPEGVRLPPMALQVITSLN